MNKLQTILKKLHQKENIDVKHRIEIINDEQIHLVYLSSLISSELLIKLVESLNLVIIKDDIITNLGVSVVEKEDNINKLVTAAFEGNALLFYPNRDLIFICDVKKYPSRGITFPEVERSVRGSKDCFDENIIDNIGLIRRRIKDENLMIKTFQISHDSKTTIALLYMKNYCPKYVINELNERIKRIDIDSLIMTESALKECIFKQNKYIVPLVRYTERPDVASINIINGKCIILVDTSCNAIITPSSILDHMKNVEEYKQNQIVGSFTKMLRLLGSFISIFLVPLFIVTTLKTSYDNGVIPVYNYQASSPILFQVLAMTVFIEIIRIAVVHTPNALISAISLLAAIVLGDISTQLGLFSPEILLVCSLSAICNYAVPSYELSLSGRLLSLFLVILTCSFGIAGFLIGVILCFTYYVNITTMSLPFLYPFCPFDTNATNFFVRKKKIKKK